MEQRPASHLAVVGDRRALAWVLAKQRIAFPPPRMRNLFPHLRDGDTLYIYTTRGVFKNTRRDRGRVVSRCTVVGDMLEKTDPVMFSGRAFPFEAPLRVESLAPVGAGVELATVAAEMDLFPKAERWSMYLRRSLVSLTAHDAQLIEELLLPLVGGLHDHLAGYQQRARMGLVHAGSAQP